jgi:hypothetical protein
MSLHRRRLMTIENHAATNVALKFSRIHHWPLFLVIALTLAASPISHQILGRTSTIVLGTLLYASGAFFVARSPRMLIACSTVGLSAAAFQAAIVIGGNQNALLTLAFHIAATGFIAIIGILVLKSLLFTTTVTGDTVLGGVTAYLLLGVFFAFLYSLTETVQPGSFALPASMSQAGGTMTWIPAATVAGETSVHNTGDLNLIYFSFTTMSTLGYGDIAPRLPLARSLSSTQTVLGQLYMAILIARLVSVARFPRDGADANG